MNPQKTITLDGRVYALDDLPPEARALLSRIQEVQFELERLAALKATYDRIHCDCFEALLACVKAGENP